MTILEELLDFLKNGKLFDRKWLGTGDMRVYIRIEINRLNIANAECGNAQRFVDFCEIVHIHNPFAHTFVESIKKEVAQLLWERDWEKANQPHCLQKKRNQGKLPGEWSGEWW